MADPKKVAKGKTFLQEVLAKIPEAKRGAAIALLEDPEAADALELAGGGALRQDDFSREMNVLEQERAKNKTWKGQLDEWWNEKNAELNSLKVKLAVAEEGKGNPNPDPNSNPDPNPPPRSTMPDLTGYLKKEEVEAEITRRLQVAEASVVPLVSVLTRIQLQHFKDFGEILDVDGLIKHSRETQLPIDRGGYESFVKDKIDAKRAKEKSEELSAAEKRGEERARAAMSTATPYPTGSPGEPTTLAGLAKKDGKSDPAYGVAAAVAEFNRRISQGAG